MDSRIKEMMEMKIVIITKVKNILEPEELTAGFQGSVNSACSLARKVSRCSLVLSLESRSGVVSPSSLEELRGVLSPALGVEPLL
jgi:hypothetical protein